MGGGGGSLVNGCANGLIPRTPQQLGVVNNNVVPGGVGGMNDSLGPCSKSQAAVERLRRRIENYRRHQNDCMPRYDHSLHGLVERDIQETILLKQKYLESKAKRTKKQPEKKPPQLDSTNLHNSLPKYGTKRLSEDLDGDAFNDPPPSKTVPPAPPPSSQADGPRFSVEIVQQLEFVGSTSNCCTINTNVTVNTSIKSDSTNSCSSSSNGGTGTTTSTTTRKGSPPDTGQQPPGPGGGLGAGGGNLSSSHQLVECKQEQPDNSEFVDLETCAAALEKDAASLTGLGELLGEESNGNIINADAFKDLISEISDFHPEFMKDFHFEEKPNSKLVTNSGALNNVNNNHLGSMTQQHHFKEELPDSSSCKNGGPPLQQYTHQFPIKSELSPAAQTLKHMAQQHQHKTQQMGGINFNPIKQEVFNGTNNSGCGAGPGGGPPNVTSLPNKQSPGGPTRPPQMNNTPPTGFKQQYSPFTPDPGSPSYHPKGGPSPATTPRPPPRVRQVRVHRCM